MNVPDWTRIQFAEGISREPVPDGHGLIAWLADETDNGVRSWSRISTVRGTEVVAGGGFWAIAATCLRTVERRRSFLARFLSRPPQRDGEATWVLPNGRSVEQQGPRQNDVLLVWTDNMPIDEARLRCRWPEASRFRKLSDNLFAVFGVVTGNSISQQARASGSPQKQAETLLAAARQAGDRHAEASALVDLGVAFIKEGEAKSGIIAFEEALGIVTQLGDQTLEEDVLGNLGRAARMVGQSPRALSLLNRALECSRRTGNRIGEKTWLGQLGETFAEFREPSQAIAYFEQALALATEVGDRQHEAALLWQLAIQHAILGHRDRAVAQGQNAIDRLRAMNHPQAELLADDFERYRMGESEGELAGPAPSQDYYYSTETGVSAPTNSSPSAPRENGAGPSLLGMAWSAAKSTSKFLASGMKTVSSQVHHKRLQTCAICEHFTGARCRVCGCFTNLKARMPHETCPLGRWPTE